MNTIKVGDFTVNRMGFGAMRLLNEDIWGPAPDKANALRVLRRAVELGVTFIDTADSYGPHTDEDLIAEALHPYPRGLVIATKGGLLRPKPSRWDEDGRPEHLKRAAEGSLKRLRLERIDVYQLHAPDPKVPFEDSVGALADLQRAGKVRHVGLSNVSVKQIEQARKLCPVVSVQNRYHFGDRKSEAVLKHCEANGIAFLPWYPLGAGDSLGNAKIKQVAGRLGITPAQAVLAWLMAKSPAMLPIPGTGSVAHLEENVAAAGIRLAPQDLEELK
jgi:aryl-alcohol dehydrogenase-like predicted oxidoreductase